MRTVKTRTPSFPLVDSDEPITPARDPVWQVLCGDAGRYRVGLYSPMATGPDDISELEQHDCPEFFWLVEGRLTLLLAKNRKLIELELEPNKPVLVSAPHAGFCPDGPQTGRALVVERDSVDTRYAAPDDFTTGQTLEFEPVDG